MEKEAKKQVSSTLIGRRSGGGMLNFGMTIDNVVEEEEKNLEHIDDPDVRAEIDAQVSEETPPAEPPPAAPEPPVQEEQEEEEAPQKPDLSRYAEEAEQDDQEESQDDVSSLRQNSYAANTALSFKQDGILPEDFEVNADMSGAEFKTRLLEYWDKEYEQRFAATHDEELVRFLDYVRQGGDVDALINSLQHRSVSNIDISGETDEALENKKALIEARYANSNLSEARVKDIVNKIFEQDEFDEYNMEEINSEAKAAKEFFQQIEQQQIEELERQHEEQLARQKQQLKEQEDLIKKHISSGKIGSIDLSKQESKELMDFIFKPSETIQVPDETGKIVTQPATGFSKQMYMLNQDIEKQLILAKLLKDGFDLNTVKSQGKAELKEDLLDKLNGTPSSKQEVVVKGSSSGSDKKRTNIKSNPVGRYRPRSF